MWFLWFPSVPPQYDCQHINGTWQYSDGYHNMSDSRYSLSLNFVLFGILKSKQIIFIGALPALLKENTRGKQHQQLHFILILPSSANSFGCCLFFHFFYLYIFCIIQH
jgi:hypothetical protein